MSLEPYSWKDRPALIEKLFPVQKLSAESFKEQMAGNGKTLTSLGSYWKGRKPLILTKACLLGSILPISNDTLKDLLIFEKLLGMDENSINIRLGRNCKDKTNGNSKSYNHLIRQAKRVEELEGVHDHIWEDVNSHFGSTASNFEEFIEQIGILALGIVRELVILFVGLDRSHLNVLD